MQPPIGRHIHWIARILQKEFNQTLEEAGGSQPVWLILLSAKGKAFATQQELARSIGIEGPTLTHHLDSMERDGLVARSRDPGNRRSVRVDLTSDGEKLFKRLRTAAGRFDERLREGISDKEIDVVRDLLTRMAENVSR
jgi:MarR family transcriptional regulator for hemolysin